MRKKARGILASLTETELNNLSHQVSRNIFNLIADLVANSAILSKQHLITDHLIVGAYVPIQSEIRWYLNDLSDISYSFAVPHLINKTQMTYYLADLSVIQHGNLGMILDNAVREAAGDKDVVPDVLLIPGLAFTTEGVRLGRGKGYFDRYLASFDGIKIGVAFESQVFKQLPCDDYDIDMDYLVTEKNIYRDVHSK